VCFPPVVIFLNAFIVPMSDVPPIVLVFSATDPTGGAGMQADILTLASMGCHPLSVITTDASVYG
jgi:hydroxymethylpyrimidine/phosphomethylpyrimidine kinase